MWTAVERDDPVIVQFLHDDQDMVRSLKDVVIVAEHGIRLDQPSSGEASLDVRAVLRAVRLCWRPEKFPLEARHREPSFPPFGCVRDSAVLRVDDERGPQVRAHLAVVHPDGQALGAACDVAFALEHRIEDAEESDQLFHVRPFDLGGFLLCVERLVA